MSKCLSTYFFTYEIIFLVPTLQMKNWGTGRLSNLFKPTHLENGRARSETKLFVPRVLRVLTTYWAKRKNFFWGIIKNCYKNTYRYLYIIHITYIISSGIFFFKTPPEMVLFTWSSARQFLLLVQWNRHYLFPSDGTSTVTKH